MSARTLAAEPEVAGHAHAHDDGTRPGPAARAMLALVHSYQALRVGHPSPCRFVPSCSQYATEALETHGALRGSWLAARRISRCRPLGGRGFDPVPER